MKGFQIIKEFVIGTWRGFHQPRKIIDGAERRLYGAELRYRFAAAFNDEFLSPIPNPVQKFGEPASRLGCRDS